MPEILLDLLKNADNISDTCKKSLIRMAARYTHPEMIEILSRYLKEDFNLVTAEVITKEGVVFFYLPYIAYDELTDKRAWSILLKSISFENLLLFLFSSDRFEHYLPLIYYKALDMNAAIYVKDMTVFIHSDESSIEIKLSQKNHVEDLFNGLTEMQNKFSSAIYLHEKSNLYA